MATPRPMLPLTQKKRNNYKPILLLLFASFLMVKSMAQNSARKIISLNAGWNFHKGNNVIASNTNAIQKVNIPHTWNAFDVMDDEPGYYRGAAWYKRKLSISSQLKNKKLYLYFEGANQETEVYLNGKKIGEHAGGYTAFRIPLTNLKYNGSDEIWVKVDNKFNESIAPLTADFTFFGGIYRNVSLLVLNKSHFEDSQYGSNGVFVHAENVSKTSAAIVINGKLINEEFLHKRLTVISSLKDAAGQVLKTVRSEITAENHQLVNFKLPTLTVTAPNLWSPEQPYCYQAITQLIESKTGKLLDEIKTTVGLRYFSFDAAQGFFLNGSPYKLIGSSRHQDYAGLGNAVPKALQVKDVALLKAMGGNFLRVAHYPQDQAVLDACDRLGILASVEIPIVNEITETEAFYRNCINMQLEMIKQNYNHPSIIIWAYMNEVLLKMKFNKEPERKLKYLNNIAALAQSLEDLTRATDPTRYTMMSNHGDVNGYIKAGLVKIPMLVGWNLYQGWYGGKIEDFGPNLDKIHQQMLDKPILVTEFGADVDPRIHAFDPVRFDKSLEYGMNYNQVYIQEILKRPFVAGAAVWNLADFSSETRAETMPHINNKGLLTLNREPKNTYYLYKAYLQQQPFVKIGDGSWTLRSGFAEATAHVAIQTLQVMSNTDTIELFLNGKPVGKKPVVAHLTNWQLPFNNGKNEITAITYAKGLKLTDRSVIDFQVQAEKLNSMQPFKSIYIALGSQRQFIDAQNHQVWLPSKVYQPGSWGSIGGEAFKIKNSGRQSYGTDRDIRNTTADPIYQTQLVGIESYQLPVPKGKYEVTLHFAELMGNGIQSVLPYNLDSLIAVGKEIPPQRIFDVYLNAKLVIKHLNLAAAYGVGNAVKKKFECLVTDEKGISLLFKSVEGKAVLNALEVKRID